MSGLGEIGSGRTGGDSKSAGGNEFSAQSLRIGSRLRAARRTRRLTLNELAHNTGISISLLSRIENEKSVPTLEALFNIAKVLDIDVATFLKVDESNDYLIKAESRQKIHDPQGAKGSTVEVITSQLGDWLLEAFLVTVRPGGHGGVATSHEGEEMGFMIDGELEITVEGTTFVAKKGDSFHFSSHLSHSHKNTGN